MRDFCPIRRIDHLEFFVGNAKQAAAFYSNAFGFTTTAYRGSKPAVARPSRTCWRKVISVSF